MIFVYTYNLIKREIKIILSLIRFKKVKQNNSRIYVFFFTITIIRTTAATSTIISKIITKTKRY